jgi:hypothetical protein
MEHDQLTKLTSEARDAAWSAWGTVDDDVLTHLINPMFMGGPAWPNTRQAFRVVRRPDELMIASDGLADPFDDPSAGRNGLEHEFYAVTSDPIDEIPGSWLWDLVWQMSQFAASHGGIASLLDEMGLISTELYDVRIPEQHKASFVNAEERVGILLGLVDSVPPAAISGPLSRIRLVNVKLLTLPELAYAVEHDEEGRQELARRFAAQGRVLASSLTRPSVV